MKELTDKQMEAAWLWAIEGLTYIEIAERFEQSPNTPKAHVKEAYRKLGLPDIRANAARRRAMRDALIALEER